MVSLLSYDIATALILLFDKDQAVLVDISLCIDFSSGSWAQERLGVLMVIGHLETSAVKFSLEARRHINAHGYPFKEQLPIPTIPAYAPAPVIDPRLVFRALRVIQATDLDLDLWNLSIEEKENSDF